MHHLFKDPTPPIPNTDTSFADAIKTDLSALPLHIKPRERVRLPGLGWEPALGPVEQRHMDDIASQERLAGVR